MSFDAGSAIAEYILKYDSVVKGGAEIKAIFAGIKADAAALGKIQVGSGSGAPQFGPTSQNTAQVVAYANAQAHLAQVENTGKNALAGLTQAEQIYKQALTQVNANSIEAIRLQTQLATVQNRIKNVSGGGLQVLPRSLENFGPQALQQIQSGLLGVVGPAAVVTAGFAAVGKAIDLTEESFELKAALDTTNLSIGLQLKNFRDVNTTLREGREFADRYKITQEENADAIQSSIPLLRQSHASLSDVEGVLSRLAVLKPEQGIRGAAFALGELEGGQARSLATRFNIPIAQANELKKKIQEGGDAVQIMDAYLNSVGLDMSTLDTRTQGATGKMNELKVETEKFQLALGGQAGGPGLALLNARLDLTRGSTRLLSGDFTTFGKSITDSVAGGQTGLLSFFNVLQPFAHLVQQLPGYQQLGVQATAAATQGTGAYDAAVQAATASIRINKNALDEDAQTKLADKIETAGLAEKQAQLDRDSQLAANGMLGAGDQAVLLAQKYGIAADQAQFLINAQQQIGNATALADQRKGEQTGTDLSAAGFNKFANLRRARDNEIANDKKEADKKAAADAKRDADKAAADADRLADLRLQGRLTNAKSSAQKIAILQGELAKTKDPIERQQLQNQIDQERLSGAKALGSAADKRLKTEESTYDSIQKQRDAMLDIEELSITGRQKDREDAAKAKTAQNILRALGDRTDARALDFRGRAQDDLALIDVQNRKRDFELEQKRATANGTITNKGQLLQSQALGTTPAPAQGGIPTPAQGAAPSAAPAPAGSTVNINLVVDGKTLASVSEPYIMDALMKAVNTAKARAGA